MMAEIDRETVKHLSQLCRINCTEKEIEKLQVDLKEILSYIDQINEVDTDNVPPCLHVSEDVFNVMRDDVSGPSISRDFFLTNAPAHIGSMISVPPANKAH